MQPLVPTVTTMDWSSVSHVLQAIYWTVLFSLAIHGYSLGSRTTI